jgi:hypothetical protein
MTPGFLKPFPKSYAPAHPNFQQLCADLEGWGRRGLVFVREHACFFPPILYSIGNVPKIEFTPACLLWNSVKMIVFSGSMSSPHVLNSLKIYIHVFYLNEKYPKTWAMCFQDFIFARSWFGWDWNTGIKERRGMFSI